MTYKRTILTMEVEYPSDQGYAHPRDWNWTEMVGETCIVHDDRDVETSDDPEEGS